LGSGRKKKKNAGSEAVGWGETNLSKRGEEFMSNRNPRAPIMPSTNKTVLMILERGGKRWKKGTDRPATKPGLPGKT